MDIQKILEKYNIKIDLRIILDKLSESHRYYHTVNHINDLISKINELFGDGDISSEDREMLIICALFHDYEYDPRRTDNEYKSAMKLQEVSLYKNDPKIKMIVDMILETKDHLPSFRLSEIFSELDMSIVESDMDTLMQWEDGIRNEYSHVDDQTYKENRLMFLESVMDRYPSNTDNLLKLCDWVKSNY